MLLKNKKTGEIVNANLKISKDGRYDSREYDSLAGFNAEWCDAPEEPFSKDFYTILEKEVKNDRN